MVIFKTLSLIFNFLLCDLKIGGKIWKTILFMASISKIVCWILSYKIVNFVMHIPAKFLPRNVAIQTLHTAKCVIELKQTHT